MTHEMRRHDLEITDSAEIDRLLASARFATVALCDGDRPYLVTLSCGYDAAGCRLCFHVAPAGRKLDIIAKNPRGCATVVVDLGYQVGECAHPYASVVMSGQLRVLEDAEEIRAAMRVLIGRLEAPEAETAIWERNALDTADALARFKMLVFEIEDLSAKSGQ
jgi:nitroimidazol reductase NimA-like FMN-containing flavoprotein (pyridoxamine 5'-phosphate oxidase superfamily)